MLTIGAPHADLHTDWQVVLGSGVFTDGPFVRKFEEEVSKLYGCEAVAFNSAGSGLFALLRCLDMKHHGAYVPVNTFFATGAMVREAGMHPILVDASLSTFSMSDVALHNLHLDPIIRQRASVVVNTPVGGGIFPTDRRLLKAEAKANKLIFIDDAAHALGIGVGDFGKDGPAVFSLFPTKAVPCGEGGVVICQDPDLAQAMREFRSYGKYIVPEEGHIGYGEGFNFRMDEFTGVVAYHQMRHIEEILERRREVAFKLATLVRPMLFWKERDTNWYKFIVPADYPAQRTTGKVYARTDQLDIALNLRRFESDDKRYPNAIHIAENHICLPLHESMSDWAPYEIEDYIMKKGNFRD